MTRKLQRRHYSNAQIIPIGLGPSPLKDAFAWSRWYQESIALCFGVEPSELWPVPKQYKEQSKKLYDEVIQNEKH